MASSDKIHSQGALIVLEGLDRCGKTSQCGLLHSYLQESGHAVELRRFPDRNTGVGQMISSYLVNQTNLDDRAIHLLFSANRWEKRSLMEYKLRSGTTLIVDRYSFSGVAFSSAKGLDVEWCKAPEAGLLAPDAVIIISFGIIVDATLSIENVEKQLRQIVMECADVPKREALFTALAKLVFFTTGVELYLLVCLR
ncbi:dTMP kinase [Castilleja foliolosa]|uniref:dTMP kinase n=1 Tax=Castilleja foliolosa TaxID=1961234 RepID=A0ABD3DCY3_9LAMI